MRVAMHVVIGSREDKVVVSCIAAMERCCFGFMAGETSANKESESRPRSA